MDSLSLKEHHARTLLIHYRWDVDKVFSVFVEKGTDKLYKEAGVIVEELNDLSSFHFSMCQVCMEDVPANEMTAMDCGHCFCNNCEHFVACCFSLSQSPILWMHIIVKILFLNIITISHAWNRNYNSVTWLWDRVDLMKWVINPLLAFRALSSNQLTKHSAYN